MASVSLHPLASRSGKQSSTLVSLQAPADRTPTLSSSAPQITTSTTCYDGEANCESDFLSSSPTARAVSPNPFGDDGFAELTLSGVEWGIHHANLEQYPVVDELSCHSSPIRAMTAKQFDALHDQYVALDVPHSVVFPFLHGVDGDNPAQCAFFHAPMTGQPTPYYRGLTIVRADMPHRQRKRASSSASKLSMFSSAAYHRSRADSLISSSFSIRSASSDEEDDCCNAGDDDDDGEGDDNVQQKLVGSDVSTLNNPFRTTSSGSSSASESRASSLFSFAGSDTTMSTQVDSDAYKAAEAAAFHARDSRQKRSSRRSGMDHLHRRSGVHDTVVDPQPTHSVLVSTVTPDEILNPPLVANLAANTLDVARQHQTVEDERCIVKGATFVRTRQAEGISLRNFKTQCAKYATISDVVIYCPAGVHDGMLNLAKWFKQAQETCYAERMERKLGGLHYNVFIITDTFETFERDHPHLVAVDGSGFSRNRVDFIEREREEMQRFTEASEIDENVFMGCTANVPYATDEYECSLAGASGNGSSVSLDSYLPHEVNPHAFSICIETAEHGELPNASRLSHASHYLDAFEATSLFELNSQCALQGLNSDDEKGTIEEEYVEDEDDSRPQLGPAGWSPGQHRFGYAKQRQGEPRLNQSQNEVLCPAPSNIVHLRALGSGSCFDDDLAEREAIDSLVGLCAWIFRQARPAKQSDGSTGRSSSRLTSWPKHQQQLARRVLLHCSDGYTDSSILGLAYLMYSRGLSLPEAYIDLQRRCNRCFFVYARDVPFLQRVEKRIDAEQQARHTSVAAFTSEPRSRNTWAPSSSSSVKRRDGGTTDDQQLYSELGGNLWTRSLAAATGLVTGASTHGSIGKRSIELGRTSTPIPRRSTPTPQSPHREPVMATAGTIVSDDSWFHNPHFQGSFPSRILPFLYLGNLAHAMNPAMLQALGITHVVSVGESALVPPSTEESLMDAAIAASTNGRNAPKLARHKRRSTQQQQQQHKTLWEEERSGRIAVLDLRNVSDDGIDSLRPHMNRAVEFIEQARLEGGKVLVHCRVGVSRSATVCIGYVMAHCDLSMIESFLLVRSRRMNVLTQPTLLFVWEMRGFEAHLTRLKQQQNKDRDNEDDEMSDGTHANPAVSLAALSLSSSSLSSSSSDSKSIGDHQSHEQPRRRNGRLHKSIVAAAAAPIFPTRQARQSDNQALTTRQSIFSDQDLRVRIGAGAGSVYGTHVNQCSAKPFNSGSSTHLDYRAAKLTHGSFCKQLSELNARYMVA